MLLPEGLSSCHWAGLGQQNCWWGDRCLAWINIPPAQLTFDSVMHELGHNMGLQHSSRDGDAYGDASCIMCVRHRLTESRFAGKGAP